MRSMEGFRKQDMHRQQQILSKPTRRSPYTSQVLQHSYADILKLEAQPSPSPQNSDGTVIWMLGYDRLP